jgi:D-glycero-alpha-D-manno-heptose 1-phosphate guanylyltransferase
VNVPSATNQGVLSITAAVVLAGGLGTRLRSTVPDVPKPMAPINGRPFLEHQLDYWIGQGICEFVISVGYRRDVIIDHFGDAYRGAGIRYAVEEHPLGTGGGFLLAAAALPPDQPFLALNGDTFFEVPLAGLAAFHRQHQANWTFALFRSDDFGRYMGMQVATDGGILSLRSASAGQTGFLANGGVYVVEPATLALSGFAAGSKASLEDDILPAILAAKGHCYGYECAGRFIDIGVPHDYFRAAELLAV